MQITRCCEALGARVEGLDISKPLDEATVKQLKAAWVEHQVLVFPEQELSPAQLIAFCKYFGNLVEHPLSAKLPPPEEGVRKDFREIAPVTEQQYTHAWHADITMMPIPPSFSLLYGRQPMELEGVDDDTLFSNQYKAYETLSPGLRQFLEGRNAVHTAKYFMGAGSLKTAKAGKGLVRSGEGQQTGATSEEVLGIPMEVLHPCIRTHPESGKRVLYVNGGFIDRFEDFTPKETQPLLKQLVAHSSREENVYRHKWKKGDLVCYDNRAVMHCGPPQQKFPKGATRYLERVTVTPQGEQRPYYLAEPTSSRL